jgi:hypothetical protein
VGFRDSTVPPVIDLNSAEQGALLISSIITPPRFNSQRESSQGVSPLELRAAGAIGLGFVESYKLVNVEKLSRFC